MDNMEVVTPGDDTEPNSKGSVNNGVEKNLRNEIDMIEGEFDEKANEEECYVPVKTSSDEEDEDDDDENEDADEAEVKILETSLIENPYDYSSHLALITKLQRMGELDRLRLARENMSSKYPLSPDIWLAWLRDEIKLAITPEQRTAVTQLCERAVVDYLSVDVWLEYLQFSIGAMGTDTNAAKNIRQLFERALTAVGLHVTKGAIIWEAFREFEAVLVSMITPDNKVEKKEQLDRVCSLFRRQLACPLLDMEKTLEEYEQWRASDGADLSVDDNIVIGGYKRALEKLNNRLSYEERLVTTHGNVELSDSYREYLLYEKENGDPGRVIVLYERAIAELSLETWVWLDYLSYIENNIKIDSVLEPIYSRASRNVPWCAKIWQKWMRTMEKWNKPLTEMQTLLEQALSTGFSTAEEYRHLWVTYIEYLRRGIDNKESPVAEEKQMQLIRDTFEGACEHLAKLFGLEGDPNCVILQYWARTEAIHANDMEKARSLWSDILSQGHSSAAASWLEYIALERCYGDTKHLRKLYQKALAAVKDWPESIANSWIDFERDEGTLEQMEFCEVRTTEKLEKVSVERQKAQQQQQQQQQQQHHSHSLENFALGKRASKRKADEGRWKNLGDGPNKLAKFDKPSQAKLVVNVEKERDVSATRESISRNTIESKPKIAPPPGFKRPADERIDADDAHEVDDKITVFVSNLDYTATEEEVKEALRPAGPITLIKLIRDYKGRSKGFGYVQLSTPAAVEEALKLDRTPIKTRPIFVSRCDPNKSTRGTGFKYRCALEKNKIFVKGLPVTATRDDLENLFGDYGALKDVRLVTYRNGHSKGLAYVEFINEASAEKAVRATDGMTIQGKVISVALSQPPERKKGTGDETSQIKSLGGTSVSGPAFGVRKALLSMIPRNVKPVLSNDSFAPSGNGVKQPLNNQDFRNMILNKK